MKVLAGLEFGFPTIASMCGIHIINGKPTLGAHLMAAAELETIQVDELVQWMGVQWAVKQGMQHNHALDSFRKHVRAIMLEGYTEVDAIGLWMEHIVQQKRSSVEAR